MLGINIKNPGLLLLQYIHQQIGWVDSFLEHLFGSIWFFSLCFYCYNTGQTWSKDINCVGILLLQKHIINEVNDHSLM